jgi:hypothetical protein
VTTSGFGVHTRNVLAKGVSLMSAQDFVTGCYPDALATMARAMFEQGSTHPFDGGEWAILRGPDDDAEVLGRGRSETEAWCDAAGLLGNQAA